jgi:hypothetical protein
VSYLQFGTAEGLAGFGTGCGCRGSAHLGDPAPAIEGRLRELAKWPDDAHAAWKKLDKVHRNLVVLQMAANYGSEFAKQFLASVGKRSSRDMVEHYYGPDVGPTPASLKGRGYKLAQKDRLHEWWVHPTGERVMRNYRASSRSTTPPRSAVCKESDTLTDSICSSADKICKLAAELNDDKSRAACQRATASCVESRKKSQSCAAFGGR